ncbi:disease resistance protein At4g27190 isoform X4 [Cicer arietinum]|uniref:disease resistance protein At4g27190 isoform X4 n=1 Tax=Cicer arietinum TaxID=3827 RepID=UPI003CC61FE2
MVSCLAELGKTYVEKLINRVTAELRFVFCFTCIAKEFEEKKPELEAERKTMEQRVQVAVSEGKVIRANVLHWIKKVDKLIQENTKTKQTCFFGFCPDCIGRYKRGKELVNMTEEIKSSIEKGEIFEIIDLPQSLPGCGYYSLDYYIQFKGRESKYKELLDALKDDNNYMTGLQGMGGTGKTTLAIKVGKELEESKKLDHVIDTTVSFTPDIKKIQDDIAGPLGLKLKDCNNSDRPKILRSRLTNGEKILLILDDVWDQDTSLDFDRIGIPKRDNHNGCRVLITTRSKRILDTMNCDKKIELEILSDEDAWIMFKNYAGINDSFSNSLTSKGQKIARECKGLPVAIAVIARSLKGQQHRKHEWDATLKSLKKHVSMPNVDDDVVGIYKCLKFSYDYMKNKKAKELLLLSSVFPEDEIISVEILTRLGIGMGLFGEDYRSYNDTRIEVVVAKNKLIDSCLLLDVVDTENKENVKMHDLVRDAAQWIANKEIWDVNLSIKDQKLLVQKEINIKYLFCKGKDMDLFSCKFECSKLETLIVDIDSEGQECIEVPNSFFENIFKLRVLYFKSTDKVNFLSLPQSIQSLTNIRSLLVEGVDLGDISILGKLPSLETLDLNLCTINELPFEITKLGKFKLLNLDTCVIRRNNLFEVIEKCSSLEELYFKYSFNNFCREITIPELQKFHIYNDWGRMKYSQSKYVNFCASDACYFSETTLNYFMRTTEFLRLKGIKRGWRNLMPEIVPIDLGMNDLVELHLSSISQLQCLIKTIGSQVPNVLSKLVVLSLDMMENLEELFNGSLSFDSLKNLERLSVMECKKFQRFFNCKLNLCNLKTLILKQCPMLVSLFPLMSQNLVQLEKLEITDCEELKNIIDVKREEESREEIDDGDNDNKRHGSIFPKLKVLDIEGCHRLESIIPFLSSQDFPVLEAISIKRCDGLKYIFSQYQHVELKSLKQMELFLLPSFIDIFPKCYDSMSLLVNESCSTSRDGFKAQIQLDPIKCNIFSWPYLCCRGDKFGSSSTTRIPLVSEDQPQEYSITSVSNSHNLHIWERAQCLSVHPHFMCNIKNIVLFQILKIKSVFILSVAPRMLETLTITNCDELKHIVIDTEDHDSSGNNWGNVFPTLKRLHVQKCMQLEYIFGHYTNDHQNHTEIHLHLPALQYLNICNLSSLVAMCPKQYRPTFPSLKELELKNCSQVDIKSIGDFIIHSVSKSQDSTIMKIVKHIKTYFNNYKKSPMVAIVVMKVQVQKPLKILMVGLKLKRHHRSIPFYLLTPEYNHHDNVFESNILFFVQIQMKLTPEAEHEFVENVPDLEIPSIAILPTNSKELVNEQSTNQQCLMNQQHPLGEIDTTAKPSQGNNCLKEIEDQNIQEGYTPEKTVAATMSTISETRNGPIQLISPKKKCVEEGTALANANTITPSTHLELVNSSKEQDVDVRYSVETAKTNDDQVSLNDAAVGKVTSTIEEQFPKDDEFRVSKSKPSPSNSIPLPLAFQTPSTPSKGNPSQIVKDLSSPSLVTRELEELVSKKHLDYQNLSLLTDFLVKHPSCLLRDTSLSNRYKGYAYHCLAELLKFLQTRSVLDVLGSGHSVFVELIQDARRFAFDKNWLDGVEKRALFPDLQFSQDAFQKLLDSKKQVTKDVEDMRWKIDVLAKQMDVFNHQLTSSEAVLESIIQQETQILETKAALSAPLGY